jgi:murein DD-endopeptidase MepM/ murein hydrolase activator NlpD
VADIFDGMPDNRAFDEMEIASREMVVFGNYVIIDHQNGEFSCFAHLQQGSIQVRKDQEVQQGQVIASIGASGSSLFPHLHYELRNGLGAREVDGLPSYFHGFRRILGANSIHVKFGQIDTGDILEPERS